jgi:hypothetical protein
MWANNGVYSDHRCFIEAYPENVKGRKGFKGPYDVLAFFYLKNGPNSYILHPAHGF